MSHLVYVSPYKIQSKIFKTELENKFKATDEIIRTLVEKESYDTSLEYNNYYTKKLGIEQNDINLFKRYFVLGITDNDNHKNHIIIKYELRCWWESFDILNDITKILSKHARNNEQLENTLYLLLAEHKENVSDYFKNNQKNQLPFLKERKEGLVVYNTDHYRNKKIFYRHIKNQKTGRVAIHATDIQCDLVFNTEDH
jgi:dsDNA-binding SOS-regulon protein